MKTCIKCGTVSPSDTNYCPNCGGSNFSSIVQPEPNENAIVFPECPSCGAKLPAFTPYCPYCRAELRNIPGAQSVEKLSGKLESLQKSSVVSSQTKRFSQSQHRAEKEREEDRQATVIRNYAIPNTKEDLLEFIILSASNISAEKNKLSEAWVAKLNQAYEKAKIVFIDDPRFSNIKSIYKSAIRKSKTELLWVLLSLIIITLYDFGRENPWF